jgi:hypothetical protein
MARPPSVVSADGIRRPWHRPGRFAWSDVESVAALELGRWGCKLNLTTGKTLPLTDIPSEKTAALAAIGGKRVAPARRPPAGSKLADRVRSDVESAADVTRQAWALAVQRKQCAAEFKRLRGDR